MNYKLFIPSFLIMASCTTATKTEDNINHEKIEATVDPAELDKLMDAWHEAASNSDLEAYFSPCANDFVFLGTDPSERWKRDEFYSFSKPYFEKGKGWAFQPTERNWMTSADGQVAWFDELLDTHFGICRGTGVLERMNDDWKLKHYSLTLTIYNESMDTVMAVNLKDSTSLE